MECIEPEEFDVLVVGSGLVEGLLAGALVRAGKSVLLLDQTDVYGSDEASFTLAGLQGSTDPQLNPNISPATADAAAQHSRTPLPPSATVIPIPAPSLPISGVETWSRPGADLGNTRAYILDLAPKVLYQGEPLVDILVNTRAHNYLEFKAVEGSYIWSGDGLRRVPASRADIFRDRSLGLADKRTLMATITACLEAHEHGSGRWAAAMQGKQPLAKVLSHEGLSQPLQDVVLYGIAMADWNQKLQHHQQQQGQRQQAEGDLLTQPLPQQHLTQRSEHHHQRPEQAAPPACVTDARGGCASLVLYTQSLGRFGAPGAFMAPSYGAGSLPEAMVRHAAVHGAVTALRLALEGLLLGPPDQQQQLPPEQQQQQQQQAGSDPRPPAQPSAVLGCLTTGGQVLRCKEALVAGPRVLSKLLPPSAAPGPLATAAASSSSPSAIQMCRAIAILDGPLQPDSTSASLVLPPFAPGCGNPHPVRGLQLSSSMCVAPPGRYLLYLSTPCTPASEAAQCGAGSCGHSILQRALQLLADCRGLQKQGDAQQDQQPPVNPSQSQVDEGMQRPQLPQQGGGAGGQHQGEEEGGRQSSKSRVLQVHYFVQELCMPAGLQGSSLAGSHMQDSCTENVQGDSSTSGPGAALLQGTPADLPAGIVCCPGPSPSMMGCVAAVEQAQRLLAQHFPGVPWLGERVADAHQGESEADDAAGQAKGGADADDEELEAIAALQASLEQLKSTEGGS